MKRVFIVHGWDGSPESDWLPWLKNELVEKGFDVSVPAMPHPEEPTIEDWVDNLEKEVGEIDEDTYFVGHSIGCQTILRLLQKKNQKCRGVVFVGGWFYLSSEVDDDPESYEIAKPWYNVEELNFEKLKTLLNTSIAIFSDNDPVVPLDNKNIFEEKLGSKIIIENNMGHFTRDDGVTELPSVLGAILEIL